MSTTQRHVVSKVPKNWKLGEYSELWKCSLFGRRITSKLKKLEGSFTGRECGELAIKKSE